MEGRVSLFVTSDAAILRTGLVKAWGGGVSQRLQDSCQPSSGLTYNIRSILSRITSSDSEEIYLLSQGVGG